jgi:hypothetical protein
MDSKEFYEFIDTSDEEKNKHTKRLSFAGIIPYNELNYAPGTMGYHQAMDRVEFTIENWHSHVCSHPAFKNPDKELDSLRDSLVEAANSIFKVYNELGSIQFKRNLEGSIEDPSYTKLGVH